MDGDEVRVYREDLRRRKRKEEGKEEVVVVAMVRLKVLRINPRWIAGSNLRRCTWMQQQTGVNWCLRGISSSGSRYPYLITEEINR